MQVCSRTWSVRKTEEGESQRAGVFTEAVAEEGGGRNAEMAAFVLDVCDK